MKVTIEVTQEDIDKGCRRDFENCPIQRAASRVLRGIVEVTEFNLYLISGTTMKSFDLPDVSADFIKDYDLELKVVKPFSFELDVPEELVKA